MDVDDSEMVKTRMEGRRRIKTTLPLYLGGVPNAQTLVVENVGSQQHFRGCIGDVTINGRSVGQLLNHIQTNLNFAMDHFHTHSVIQRRVLNLTSCLPVLSTLAS